VANREPLATQESLPATPRFDETHPLPLLFRVHRPLKTTKVSWNYSSITCTIFGGTTPQAIIHNRGSPAGAYLRVFLVGPLPTDIDDHLETSLRVLKRSLKSEKLSPFPFPRGNAPQSQDLGPQYLPDDFPLFIEQSHPRSVLCHDAYGMT
jgi:hypothetical protein